MNNNQQATPPKGYTQAPSEYFTGTAWLKLLVTPDEITNCTITDVLFEPSSRNFWHTHPSNQILVVTEGIGYYQEEGSPIREIHAGDVINVLPGIKHWHGASPNNRLKHTAININSEKGTVNWIEPVSDEDYYIE
jgi:quercetin dioxygenase-like cupin family protein